MFRSLSSKKSHGSSASSSQRKKTDSSRRRAESVASSSSHRKQSRNDERYGKHEAKNPPPSLSAYTSVDASSGPSSYYTAPDRHDSTRPQSLTEEAIRTLGMQEDAWEDVYSRASAPAGERAREEKKHRSSSSSRERGSRKDVRDKPTQARLDDSYVAERSAAYEAYQPDVHSMSSRIQDQFPGQNPSIYSAPAFNPASPDGDARYGLAAGYYYGDQSQSFAAQPLPPSINSGYHSRNPSNATMPGASNGTANEYYTATSMHSPAPATSSHTSQYPSAAQDKSAKSNKPTKSTKPVNPYATSSAAPSTNGGVLGYAASNPYQNSAFLDQQHSSASFYHQASDSASPVNSAFPNGYHHHSQSVPSAPNSAEYYVPPHSSRPSNPGKQPSNATYMASAAGLAADAYGLHHHHEHRHGHSASLGAIDGTSPYYHASPSPYTSGSMAKKHRHKGPISKFVDWWKDYEDVRKMEEYTEYIGVCKYCFDPRTSVVDAPRKHHYEGRRSSSESLRRRSSDSLRRAHTHGSKVGRVDKESRYYSSDNERRRKNSSWLGAGIAAYGLTKVGKSLWQNTRDFDDTYSVKSGQHNHASKAGSRKHRERSRSAERRTHSERGTIKEEDHESFFAHPQDDRKSGFVNTKVESHPRSSKEEYYSATAGASLGAAAAHLDSDKDEAQIHLHHPSSIRDPSSKGVTERRRHDSRSGSYSPLLGEILGFTSSKKRQTPTVSRSSSPQEEGLLGGFFSRQPSRTRTAHRRKKSFFIFTNSSSSSSNSDLAFGSGHPTKDVPLRKVRTNKSDEHLRATLLGIGATAAALTAAQKGVVHARRRPELAVVRDRKDKQIAHDRDRDRSRRTTSEEDGWESASDDGTESVSSGLAFGDFDVKNKGPARRSSLESITSQSSGTDKWSWRWRRKSDKKRLSTTSPPAYPSRPAYVEPPSSTHPYGGDYPSPKLPSPGYECNSRGAASADINTSPSQPMQLIHPMPISDALSLEASGTPAVPGAFPEQPPLQISRPEAVPLQQPQPVTPVQPGIFAPQALPQPSRTEPSAPNAFARPTFPPGPRRTQSSPITSHTMRDAALVGLAGAATASILANGKNKNVKDESPSSVRFDLTDKQAKKEERVRRKEEAKKSKERAKADRERALKEEASRQAFESQRRQGEETERRQRLTEEAARHEARLREEAAERAREQEADELRQKEIEAFMRDALAEQTLEAERKLRDEMRPFKQEQVYQEPVQSPQSSANPWAYQSSSSDHGIGPSHGGIETRDDEKPSSAQETQYATRSFEPTNEHSGQPLMDDDVDDPEFFSRRRSQSDLQRHEELARKAAAKVISDLEDRYRDPAPSQAAFFAPKELFASEKGKAKTYGPVEGTDFDVYRVPGIEFGNMPNEPPPPYQASREFVALRDDKGDKPYWSIPKLNVIAPTPPTSYAGSARSDKSPVVDPEHETRDEQMGSESNGERRSTISWGEDQTSIHEVQTPELPQEHFVAYRERPHGSSALRMESLDNQFPLQEPIVTVRDPDDQPSASAAEHFSNDSIDEEVTRETPSVSSGSVYQRPFVETVPDIAFTLESPGTEGTPPVQGFVEGEIEDSGLSDDPMPHVPGGFDDVETDEPEHDVRDNSYVFHEAQDQSSLSRRQGKKPVKELPEHEQSTPLVSVQSTGRQAFSLDESVDHAEPERSGYVESKKEKRKWDDAAKHAFRNEDRTLPSLKSEEQAHVPQQHEERHEYFDLGNDKHEPEGMDYIESAIQSGSSPEETYDRTSTHSPRRAVEQNKREGDQHDSGFSGAATAALAGIASAIPFISDRREPPVRRKSEPHEVERRTTRSPSEPRSSQSRSTPSSPIYERRASVPGHAFDDLDMLPGSRRPKKTKRNSLFNFPTIGSPLRTAMTLDDYVEPLVVSQDKESRDIEPFEVHATTEEPKPLESHINSEDMRSFYKTDLSSPKLERGAMSVASAPIETGDSGRRRKSRKSHREGDGDGDGSPRRSQSVAASEPIDLHESSRKHKRRSHRDNGEFDDEASVTSARSSHSKYDDDESRSKKKGGFLSLFRRKSTDSAPRVEEPRDIDDEGKHRKRHHRRRSSERTLDDDDRRSSTSRSRRHDDREMDDTRSQHSSSSRHRHRHHRGGSVDEDAGSQASESRRRHKHRRREESLPPEDGIDDSRSRISESRRKHKHKSQDRSGERKRSPSRDRSSLRERDQSFLEKRVEDEESIPLPALSTQPPTQAPEPVETLAVSSSPTPPESLGATESSAPNILSTDVAEPTELKEDTAQTPAHPEAPAQDDRDLTQGVASTGASHSRVHTSTEDERPSTPPRPTSSGSEVLTPARPKIPLRINSSTTIPLRFRYPPTSPGVPRERSASFSSTIAQSPVSPVTPKSRHNRPNSSEFSHSTEFRPLYLLERTRKPQEPEEEQLPSLPSSRTTSRASSLQSNEEWQSAAEELEPSENGDRGLSVATEPLHEEVEDVLGSTQTTPKATEFPPNALNARPRSQPEYYSWDDIEREEKLRAEAEKGHAQVSQQTEKPQVSAGPNVESSTDAMIQEPKPSNAEDDSLMTVNQNNPQPETAAELEKHEERSINPDPLATDVWGDMSDKEQDGSIQLTLEETAHRLQQLEEPTSSSPSRTSSTKKGKKGKKGKATKLGTSSISEPVDPISESPEVLERRRQKDAQDAIDTWNEPASEKPETEVVAASQVPLPEGPDTPAEEAAIEKDVSPPSAQDLEGLGQGSTPPSPLLTRKKSKKGKKKQKTSVWESSTSTPADIPPDAQRENELPHARDDAREPEIAEAQIPLRWEEGPAVKPVVENQIEVDSFNEGTTVEEAPTQALIEASTVTEGSVVEEPSALMTKAERKKNKKKAKKAAMRATEPSTISAENSTASDIAELPLPESQSSTPLDVDESQCLAMTSNPENTSVEPSPAKAIETSDAVGELVPEAPLSSELPQNIEDIADTGGIAEQIAALQHDALPSETTGQASSDPQSLPLPIPTPPEEAFLTQPEGVVSEVEDFKADAPLEPEQVALPGASDEDLEHFNSTIPDSQFATDVVPPADDFASNAEQAMNEPQSEPLPTPTPLEKEILLAQPEEVLEVANTVNEAGVLQPERIVLPTTTDEHLQQFGSAPAVPDSEFATEVTPTTAFAPVEEDPNFTDLRAADQPGVQTISGPVPTTSDETPAEEESSWFSWLPGGKRKKGKKSRNGSPAPPSSSNEHVDIPQEPFERLLDQSLNSNQEVLDPPVLIDEPVPDTDLSEAQTRSIEGTREAAEQTEAAPAVEDEIQVHEHMPDEPATDPAFESESAKQSYTSAKPTNTLEESIANKEANEQATTPTYQPSLEPDSSSMAVGEEEQIKDRGDAALGTPDQTLALPTQEPRPAIEAAEWPFNGDDNTQITQEVKSPSAPEPANTVGTEAALAPITKKSKKGKKGKKVVAENETPASGIEQNAPAAYDSSLPPEAGKNDPTPQVPEPEAVDDTWSAPSAKKDKKGKKAKKGGEVFESGTSASVEAAETGPSLPEVVESGEHGDTEISGMAIEDTAVTEATDEKVAEILHERNSETDLVKEPDFEANSTSLSLIPVENTELLPMDSNLEVFETPEVSEQRDTAHEPAPEQDTMSSEDMFSQNEPSHNVEPQSQAAEEEWDAPVSKKKKKKGKKNKQSAPETPAETPQTPTLEPIVESEAQGSSITAPGELESVAPPDETDLFETPAEEIIEPSSETPLEEPSEMSSSVVHDVAAADQLRSRSVTPVQGDFRNDQEVVGQDHDTDEKELQDIPVGEAPQDISPVVETLLEEEAHAPVVADQGLDMPGTFSDMTDEATFANKAESINLADVAFGQVNEATPVTLSSQNANFQATEPKLGEFKVSELDITETVSQGEPLGGPSEPSSVPDQPVQIGDVYEPQDITNTVSAKQPTKDKKKAKKAKQRAQGRESLASPSPEEASLAEPRQPASSEMDDLAGIEQPEMLTETSNAGLDQSNEPPANHQSQQPVEAVVSETPGAFPSAELDEPSETQSGDKPDTVDVPVVVDTSAASQETEAQPELFEEQALSKKLSKKQKKKAKKAKATEEEANILEEVPEPASEPGNDTAPQEQPAKETADDIVASENSSNAAATADQVVEVAASTTTPVVETSEEAIHRPEPETEFAPVKLSKKDKKKAKKAKALDQSRVLESQEAGTAQEVQDEQLLSARSQTPTLVDDENTRDLESTSFGQEVLNEQDTGAGNGEPATVDEPISLEQANTQEVTDKTEGLRSRVDDSPVVQELRANEEPGAISEEPQTTELVSQESDPVPAGLPASDEVAQATPALEDPRASQDEVATQQPVEAGKFASFEAPTNLSSLEENHSIEQVPAVEETVADDGGTVEQIAITDEPPAADEPQTTEKHDAIEKSAVIDQPSAPEEANKTDEPEPTQRVAESGGLPDTSELLDHNKSDIGNGLASLEEPAAPTEPIPNVDKARDERQVVPETLLTATDVDALVEASETPISEPGETQVGEASLTPVKLSKKEKRKAQKDKSRARSPEPQGLGVETSGIPAIENPSALPEIEENSQIPDAVAETFTPEPVFDTPVKLSKKARKKAKKAKGVVQSLPEETDNQFSPDQTAPVDQPRETTLETLEANAPLPELASAVELAFEEIKQTMGPATENTPETAAELTNEPNPETSQVPVAQPSVQSVTDAIEGSIAEPPAGPAFEHHSQPVVDPLVEMTAKTNVGSTAEPFVDPIVQPVIESTIMPAVEDTTEYISEPDPKGVAESLGDSQTTQVAPESFAEPILEPIAESTTELSGEPETQQATDSSREVESSEAAAAQAASETSNQETDFISSAKLSKKDRKKAKKAKAKQQSTVSEEFQDDVMSKALVEPSSVDPEPIIESGEPEPDYPGHQEVDTVRHEAVDPIEPILAELEPTNSSGEQAPEIADQKDMQPTNEPDIESQRAEPVGLSKKERKKAKKGNAVQEVEPAKEVQRTLSDERLVIESATGPTEPVETTAQDPAAEEEKLVAATNPGLEPESALPRKQSKKEKRKAKKGRLTDDQQVETALPAPETQDTSREIEDGPFEQAVKASDHMAPQAEVQTDIASTSQEPVENLELVRSATEPGELPQSENDQPAEENTDVIQVEETAQPAASSDVALPSNEGTQAPQDIDFAATLAAGLQDSGFDPNLVINDPAFHQRASPSGGAEADPEETPSSPSSRLKKRDSQNRELSPSIELSQEHTAAESTARGDASNDDFSDILTAGLAASGFAAGVLSDLPPEKKAALDEPEEFSFAISRRKKKGKKEKNTTLDAPPSAEVMTSETVQEAPVDHENQKTIPEAAEATEVTPQLAIEEEPTTTTRLSPEVGPTEAQPVEIVPVVVDDEHISEPPVGYNTPRDLLPVQAESNDQFAVSFDAETSQTTVGQGTGVPVPEAETDTTTEHLVPISAIEDTNNDAIQVLSEPTRPAQDLEEPESERQDQPRASGEHREEVTGPHPMPGDLDDAEVNNREHEDNISPGVKAVNEREEVILPVTHDPEPSTAPINVEGSGLEQARPELFPVDTTGKDGPSLVRTSEKPGFFHTSEVSQFLPVSVDDLIQPEDHPHGTSQVGLGISGAAATAAGLGAAASGKAEGSSMDATEDQEPGELNQGNPLTPLAAEQSTWSFDNLESPIAQEPSPVPEPIQGSRPADVPRPTVQHSDEQAKDATPPSPVESTTKDRTSYLFQSPPDAARRAKTPQPQTIRKQTRFSEPMDYFGSGSGYQGMEQPRTPPAPMPPSPSKIDGAPLPPSPPRIETPLAPLPPSPRRATTPVAPLPPSPRQYVSPSIARKKSRDISDVGSPGPGHSIKAARRTATPLQSFRERTEAMAQPTSTSNEQGFSQGDIFDDHGSTVEITRSSMGNVRSASVQSNRSNNSTYQLRSPSVANNHSAAPSLRRIDRSTSGDLRAASRRRETPGPKTIPIEPPPTPPLQEEEDGFNGHGASRAADMANVYAGWGDVHGSPSISPTRPPSMRKRQSMHILDLENKLDQLVSENRQLQEAFNFNSPQSQNVNSVALQEALSARELQLQEKDAEIQQIRALLEPLQKEIARLTEVNGDLSDKNQNLIADSNNRFATLQSENAQTHKQWEQSNRELENLRRQHHELSDGMEDIVRQEIANALEDKNAEIRRLREELDIASQKIRLLQSEILASKGDNFLTLRDEDYFDTACQKLCQHVQQWVLRFSKYSDNRMCRLTSDLTDEKIQARLDNAILDGSDVDKLLGDRVRRRDVFMSVVMTMIWEYVFTRYLFGMDREQRQKLKSLEKILAEVGPPRAVALWRATTLTLLSRRPAFATQRNLDTEAVAQEIFSVLSALLPPPSQLETQIMTSLRNVLRLAVDLSIEMRMQKAEYIMLPPLQPEYDTQGDLIRKVHFNAALMNERSGDYNSNDELEKSQAVVKIVLFPLVVKKGDDIGEGEDEIIVCPAQVLVAGSKQGKKVVRVLSGAMEIDDQSRHSKQSLISGFDGSNII